MHTRMNIHRQTNQKKQINIFSPSFQIERSLSTKKCLIGDHNGLVIVPNDRATTFGIIPTLTVLSQSQPIKLMPKSVPIIPDKEKFLARLVVLSFLARLLLSCFPSFQLSVVLSFLRVRYL